MYELLVIYLPLFVFFSFFFCPLYCLNVFESWFLIILLVYLQTISRYLFTQTYSKHTLTNKAEKLLKSYFIFVMLVAVVTFHNHESFKLNHKTSLGDIKPSSKLTVSVSQLAPCTFFNTYILLSFNS